MPTRLHRAGRDAGQEVEGSGDPSPPQQGVSALGSALPVPGDGSGARRVAAARLFAASEHFGDGTALMDTGHGPPPVGGEGAGLFQMASGLFAGAVHKCPGCSRMFVLGGHGDAGGQGAKSQGCSAGLAPAGSAMLGPCG